MPRYRRREALQSRGIRCSSSLTNSRNLQTPDIARQKAISPFTYGAYDAI